jgi:hypothetical protein
MSEISKPSGGRGDGDDAAQRPSFGARAQVALFQVCGEINRDPSIHPVWAVVLMIIDGLQMLSFPLNTAPSGSFRGQPLMNSLLQGLQPTFIQVSARVVIVRGGI